MIDRDDRVLVIGGGVAGLVTALDLAGAGLRPIVLEAGESCGGVLSSHRVAGLTLDAGAESFATGRPAVGELVARLGLTDRIAEPNPVGAWVRFVGGVAPLPATSLLGIPGDPTAPDVRRVIGLAGVLRSRADALLPARIELYDLAKDIAETTNLAASQPDVVARLQARIDVLSREAVPPLLLTEMLRATFGAPPSTPDFVFVNDD